ncbi:hypothetical protein LARV_01715 [Longilinea arvoryzae]|uniref:Dolichyl-phosphate-mannose-protein mannosyltransferase n=1 Tax=Longilinea arvoryzae TaxID=360412 RepID=A0A0S7BG04_9CHLR|nr:hypothetical protein [Longilinea arvoryzae]GAP13956.1 hypothetical protein LARV_01715 [Longilinea arvoryzae]
MSSSTDAIRETKVRDYSKIVFVVMLLFFFAYGVFIARTLDGGIIPDEQAHFLFAKHYSNTLGIPLDTTETITTGWNIAHNPFLFYWISGRVINFVQLVYPKVNDWQLLVILRLVNLVFSLGSILFCYRISKEVIKNKWYQLLPSFLLINTLMFVFVASGVNYDNLAVLCSMGGLYFLLQALIGNEFYTNSLAWMMCISFGTLVKFTILPLALIMFIVWLIYTLKNRKSIFPLPMAGWKRLLMMVGLILLIGGNLAIYGYNLVTFKWILPNCNNILSDAQCELNPYLKRYREQALDHKLSVAESIDLGYPDPVEYVAYVWGPLMFDRTYGIAGHKVYYPAYITCFQLLFAWGVLLAVRYWKRPTSNIINATVISIAYALVLIVFNYNNELIYGFKNYGLTGRYLFPVIGLVYGLYGYTIEQIRNKPIQIITLLVTLALFLVGGPIEFLWHYNTVFSTWFIH